MGTSMNTSLAKAKAMLDGYSGGQKFVGVILLAALLMAGTVFYTWVSAPSYAPAFSGLSGEDSSAIAAKLDADGVKYQFVDGGSGISVPKDLVATERVAMAGAGLPANSEAAGWGLMDKASVTASTFTQQLTYQRALEGELAKTVNVLDGVKTSVVHLAIPAKDVFLDSTSTPEASVLIDLKPGAELSSQQVQSVVHLVASAVPDLDSKNVTVSDATGRLFSAPGIAAGAAGVDSNAQQTISYEASQAADLQSVVDKIVGPGHGVVKVSADLQFDSVQKETTRVFTDPKAQPNSKSVSTEKMTGGNTAGSTGVLGTETSPIPTPSAGATGAPTAGNYEKVQTVEDGANSQEKTVETPALGTVQKQSVSVVVDTKASNVDLAKLQTALTAAAGIDTARGDTIAVTSLPFDTTTATAAKADLADAAAAQKQATMIGYAKQGLMVLGIVIFLLVAMISRKKRQKARAADELVQLEMLEMRANSMAIAGPGPAIGKIDLPALEAASAPALPVQRRKDDVLAMVERQPDEVAELLRGWLADRRG